tara:strand:+ start:770 stop:1000 length:231 start_codon:yes stop_codon:yes gene_type:complete
LNSPLQNIIQQIKHGDESPLIDLYRLHRNEFISWSCKEFRANEEQAKDAFQEAILDFHQNVVSGGKNAESDHLLTF